MHNSKFWREKLVPYTVKSDLIGARQVFFTLVPFVLLWVGYAYCVKHSLYYVVPFSILVALFILRCFVMMHDCGHGVLFKSRRANHVFGFLFGVITGMPQYVWSKNHAYHHKTNGDWISYGGVFNIITTNQYANLSKRAQRRYRFLRQPLILIPAGFFYVLFNPRFNWIAGTLVIFLKVIRSLLTLNLTETIEIVRKWETKFWKGKKDYLHMTYNNLLLLSVWFVACAAIGTKEFFLLYVISISMAGSVGILLFAVQHNFENSYATDTVRVNPYRAALEGTSMLALPKVLNWFTADIAYHHVHHLSVAIPNYKLAACHKKFENIFVGVKRIYCRELLSTFKYQLWDDEQQKVVAVSAQGS